MDGSKITNPRTVFTDGIGNRNFKYKKKGWGSKGILQN